ncbi:MAG: radical SAM protein [Candidatus Zixiibacteriota bacterium]|nr:MAG: radical SAM protein [candidate division Zixibacteria bacterium]
MINQNTRNTDSPDDLPVWAAETLGNCHCCPRDCKADRFSHQPGWCRAGADFWVSSICAHHGEEPVLSGPRGMCNIFFSHCNMQCIFCQNYQISDNRLDATADSMTLDEIAGQIQRILDLGAKGVGFVSPSHFVPQMRMIMHTLHRRGLHPTYVYNTNGYDTTDMIASLSEEIDVYLPDFKYMDGRIAGEYSATPDYPEIASGSVREMFRQKGADITLDDEGYITSGLIIRHLVLPGHVDNSKRVLRYIAEKLSPDIYISLMSQYYPTVRVAGHPRLGRTLYPEEYHEVLDEFTALGFHRGFVQELSSPHHYKPDFMKEHPFED